eukprot:2503539-Rhodomonas_salina.2
MAAGMFAAAAGLSAAGGSSGGPGMRAQLDPPSDRRTSDHREGRCDLPHTDMSSMPEPRSAVP